MENHLDGIHWVIVGGESGRKALSMPEQWAKHIRLDCPAAGVPFFFKQGSAANWPAYKDSSSFPGESAGASGREAPNHSRNLFHLDSLTRAKYVLYYSH